MSNTHTVRLLATTAVAGTLLATAAAAAAPLSTPPALVAAVAAAGLLEPARVWASSECIVFMCLSEDDALAGGRVERARRGTS